MRSSRSPWRRLDDSADAGRPCLRFTPYAWGKFVWFRDRGPTEIGGFGISAVEDLLLVVDFVPIGQRATPASVEFDDDAVADHFDHHADLGLAPDRFARLWLHTHPDCSASPSLTDEETFDRVFGRCDWAVMAIVARGGETYARLRASAGPGCQCLIPVAVDFSEPFLGSDHEVWEAEYAARIHVNEAHSESCGGWGAHQVCDSPRWLDEFDLSNEGQRWVEGSAGPVADGATAKE